MINRIAHSSRSIAAPGTRAAAWLLPLALLAACQPLDAADDSVTKLSPFEVTSQSTVIGDAPQSNMSKIEVYSTAGGAGDINRALQVLPGVSMVDEGNALFVRGGASDETRTFVNDIPFPTTRQSETPAGTFDTTLATSYMERSSLYAGDVPVRYGDVLSGVVSLETLYPVKRRRITIDAAIGGAGGLVQSPLGSGGGWDIGAAASDLSAVVRLNPSPFKYSTPPRSGEVFISADVAPSPGTDAQIVGYQKNTDSAFSVSSPDFTGPFRNSVKTSFAAGRIRGTTEGGWEWKIAAGGGRQVRAESLGTLNLATESTYGAFVADGTRDLSPTMSLGAGADMLVSGGGVRGTVPSADSLSPSIPPTAIDFFSSDSQVSAYASLNWRPVRTFEVVAGLRTDSFLRQAGGTALEPRISLAWHVAPDTSLRFYSGELTKAATPAQLAVAEGRPEPARAQETSVTFAQKGRHFTLQLSAFLKTYKDLNEVNREFRTVGGNSGTARGITAGFKTNVIRHVTLGLDYTLSRSYRTDPNTGLPAASAFDVLDTLNLTSQFQVGYSTIAVSYRFATGKPYTPVVGSTPGPAAGQFTPNYGPPESGRLPDFDRIDVTFSRLLFIKHQLWVPYFSIMNVLNKSNTYGYTYSSDYRQKIAQPSLIRRTLYFGVSTSF